MAQQIAPAARGSVESGRVRIISVRGAKPAPKELDSKRRIPPLGAHAAARARGGARGPGAAPSWAWVRGPPQRGGWALGAREGARPGRAPGCVGAGPNRQGPNG